MWLLRDVLFQRDRADVRWLNLSEIEQLRRSEFVRPREELVADADIDEKLREESSADVGVGPEADAADRSDIGLSDALDAEFEAVVRRFALTVVRPNFRSVALPASASSAL